MSKAPIRYLLDLAGRSFEVHRITGEEAMSRPFRLEIDFVLSDMLPLVPDDVVKSAALLRLDRDGEHVRGVPAVVTDVRVWAAMRGVRKARVVLEPRLALARHRTDIRVFRKKTAPEIVREVLSYHGVEIEERLASSYERRDYCVQFRESDLHFAHRLLEDEGIYYYLTEAGTMVLGDAASAYEPTPMTPLLRYRGAFGMDQSDDALLSVGTSGRVGPGKVSLRDFNPEKPKLDMDVSAATKSPTSAEWYDYPGEFMDPGAGAVKAQLTAEAMDCENSRRLLRSSSGFHAPGHGFVVDGAPLTALDGPVVVVAVKHDWDREAKGFAVDLSCLAGDVTYRPPRVTVPPTCTNPLTGFVTTPPGDDDIYTDAWGRVKVHFPWDRLQPKDGECSHWVPILQDNTGMSSAIGRRGWEVLVYFMEGDPDRPVVAGRVFNVEDQFADKLPDLKTRTSIRSMVTPARDGYNEIRFDDRDGGQELFVHAQKDQNIVIANNKTAVTVFVESLRVENDESIKIGNDQKITTLLDSTVEVAKDQTTTIGGNRKVTVGEGETVEITGNRSMTIGGMHYRRIGSTDSQSAKNLSEKVGGVILETSLDANGLSAQKVALLTVGGAIVEVAPKGKTETSNLLRADTVGGMFMTKADDDISTRASKKRNTMTPIFKVKSKEEMILTGTDTLKLKGAKVKVEGSEPTITLKVGDTTVVLSEGVIAIKATDEIIMRVDGKNDQNSGESIII